MKKKRILIILLLCLTVLCSFGQIAVQCDSIKIYDSKFDRLFQDQYNSISADTILAIRHCSSTNGCQYTYGLLCWKSDGVYNFSKMERRKGKIKSTTRLSNLLKIHLIKFYEERVFEKRGEQDAFGLDDGPYTLVLFKMAKNCWEFNYESSSSEDKRVIWTKELERIMRR